MGIIGQPSSTQVHRSWRPGKVFSNEVHKQAKSLV